MIDIVLGTFFGDEGKGQCVNNLCKEDSIVIRFSGANQVGHNVQCNGLQHCFRNFGSGTFKGIPTYWSAYCVCDLHTLVLETTELYKLGIVPKIIFSPFCELVTPFDVINQWNNSTNREHGTVGTGFKSVLDRVKNGYSLTIADARNLLILREKVYNIERHYYKFTSEVPTTNLDEWIVGVNKIANAVEIEDITYLNSYDHLVFEGSQGILLDQTHGVMPFCTPSYTTSRNAMEIIKSLDRKEIPTVNYVCRPYITRHGSGPLLTSTPVIEVEDVNNQWNDFQKTFRACKFDTELLKHSIFIDSLYSKAAIRNVVFSHGDEVPASLEQRVKELPNVANVHKFEYERWK